MFTAGGRLAGAKISEVEKAAMHKYIEAFILDYPEAVVHEQLGMAEVELTDEQVAILQTNPNIWYIQPFIPMQPYATTQANAPWHLTNITNTTTTDYEYTTTGKGITVYIGDTGIDINHTEFEGRAFKGMYVAEPTNPHGTHVAGIVGSATYGVAKECKLVDVQMFDPANDGAGAIYYLMGLNWILDTHVAGEPAVLNLSLGGPAHPSNSYSDDALLALIAEGVIVVVAAGNETDLAANHNPANLPAAITVGAIDSTNTITWFSNYGASVDIFAPGELILSTVLNYEVDSMSGTSMATPVVAGVVARYLELCPSVSQATMQSRLRKYGVADVQLGATANTTNLRTFANIPGLTTSAASKLSKLLNGTYRKYYFIGGIEYFDTAQVFNEVSRSTLIRKTSTTGSVEFAVEVKKVTDPVVDPPIVIAPVVVPPTMIYDGYPVVWHTDFSITYKYIVYAPTITGDTYHYYVADLLDITVVKGATNNFTITSISMLPVFPNPQTYDGGTLFFNDDHTIEFKGLTYAPTLVIGNRYYYDYLNIMYVEVLLGTTSVVTTVSVLVTTPPTITVPPIVIPPTTINQLKVIAEDDPEAPKKGTWENAMQKNSKVYTPPKAPTITEIGSVRMIAIDVAEPTKIATYQISVGWTSGTFSYTGYGLTLPAHKDAITVQALLGRVERIARSSAQGSVPQTVEGRLIPAFNKEQIFLSYPLKTDGTQYWTESIVQAIATAAGITVTFLATTSAIPSWEFTGKFINALEQMAEHSCGRLLQQNGVWKIVPKVGYNSGTFTVKSYNVISYNRDVQSDITDTILGLLDSYKQSVLDRDAAQRVINRGQAAQNNSSSSSSQDTSEGKAIQMPSINFTFGWNGKSMVEINENIMVETQDNHSSNWDTWALGTNATQYYYKREPVSNGSGTITHMRGLKSLNLTTFYYPIQAPTNVKKYMANGALANLDMPLFQCSPRIVSELPVTVINKAVSGMGEHDTIFPHTYVRFSVTYANEQSTDDKKFYSGQLDMCYIAKPDTAGQDAVTAAGQAKTIAEAKIRCISNELATYGVSISGMDSICALWKVYYDLVDDQQYNKSTTVTTVQINAAELAAKTQAGTYFGTLDIPGRITNVSVSCLYENIMPLPAQKLVVEAVTGADITTDDCVIESFTFNGSILNITATKAWHI